MRKFCLLIYTFSDGSSNRPSPSGIDESKMTRKVKKAAKNQMMSSPATRRKQRMILNR